MNQLFPLRVFAIAAILAAALGPLAGAGRAQQGQKEPVPFWRQPQAPPASPAPAAPPTPRTTPPQQRAATPAGADSSVIARVNGRPITQRDFDAIAQPYFARLRADFGGQLDGDVRQMANHNVLDELLRRELVTLEAQRAGVEVTQADIDAILQQDPFFLTNGKFDPVKYNSFKTSPTSNYLQVLPRVREMAAVNKYDARLRESFTPTPAAVRAEWAKRNDQVRFRYLPLLVRDMSFEGEATEDEWKAYFDAHPDQFMKRARAALRYVRIALPAEGDSAREAEQKSALERARGIADSLAAGTLADSSERFSDTGPFDLPATVVPGLGRDVALLAAVNQVETDSTRRLLGPLALPDAVVVAAVTDRQPKRLPAMREVLGDVKRRADAEKRRTVAEADRRAFFESRRDRWQGPRVALTRVVLSAGAVPVKAPTRQEVDRWYAQHGRVLFDMPDSSKAWFPPISDSLRRVAGERMVEEQRPARLGEALARLAAGLRTSRDARGLARSNGAAAETLALARHTPPDTLFPAAFVDSLLASGPEAAGAVQGPRVFGGRGAVWRIDAVDTAFVPAYEAVRARSDQEFNDDRRRRDEEEARAYFDQHRDDFKTPVRYVLEYVAVPVPPADSVQLADAELRRHYDANLATYRQDEQVHAAHILLSTRGADSAADAVARARADSLRAALEAGADFTDLAKRFSQEPGAATSGGDLGWFGRGRMVPEFETAAFALQPGGLSPVVKTQFGYHVIRMIERREAGQRAFEEVREEIRRQLSQTQGDSLARRQASALRRRLAAAATPAAQAAAAAAHGGLRTTTPVSVSEPVPGLGFVPGLAQVLPGLALRRWAPEVYRAGTNYVAFRILEKVPPRPAEFDEAKNQAIEDMKSAKRRAVHATKVAAIRAALAAGASLDSLAAPYGGLRDSGPLTQAAGFIQGVGAEPRIVQRVFAMKAGEVSDTLQIATGVLWAQVEDKKSGDAAAFRQQRQQIADELMRRRMEEWLEQKRKTAKIEILRPDLRGPRPSPVRTVTMSTGG
jgi:parvulin-like peptidyl-prolyl isomerase